MAGTSSQQQANTTRQEQTTNPFAAAQPALSGILSSLGGISTGLTPQQQSAIDQLTALGQAGDPYGAQRTNVANTFLSGGTDRTGTINDAYQNYLSGTDATARGDFLDPNKNPFFGQTVSTIGNDVQNRVNAQYAAAGRAPSGAGSYGYSLGRGVAEGTAPVFGQVYNQERTNQLGTLQNRFSAGGQTTGILGGLDQAKYALMQSGMSAADAANAAQQYGPLLQLYAQSQQTGIPLQTLAAQAGIALPIGSAFGTTSGTSTGTGTGSNKMSGAQQFATITGGLRNLLPGSYIGSVKLPAGV